jgi:hypothetical protein
MTVVQINIQVGYQDTKDPAGHYTRWTEDATGHKWWTFPVDVKQAVTVVQTAEAVFKADNAPFELAPDSLAGKIREAMIEAYENTTERHHSLSVGDRIRIGEDEVICSDDGWKRVPSDAAALLAGLQRGIEAGEFSVFPGE